MIACMCGGIGELVLIGIAAAFTSVVAWWRKRWR